MSVHASYCELENEEYVRAYEKRAPVCTCWFTEKVPCTCNVCQVGVQHQKGYMEPCWKCDRVRFKPNECNVCIHCLLAELWEPLTEGFKKTLEEPK